MMAKTNKPNSDADVLTVMKDYCEKKGYKFSNAQLDYMAQDCYFYYESKGWKNISYWPAVAMRWVLTNLKDQQIAKQSCSYAPKQNYRPKQKGQSVRDKIMRQENMENEDG